LEEVRRHVGDVNRLDSASWLSVNSAAR
jgi:hypothetical protein